MKINRLAISSFFFFIGFLYANWVARLPELQRLFGVSNATLGTLLLCWAAGAIVAMPFTGWLSVRFGTRSVSQITAFVFCLLVPVIPLFSNLWLIGSLFFLLGMNNGALDVTINGQAVYVERMYDKPIMSSFHGVFSVGMALGAGSGALFAMFSVPLFPHLLVVSCLCFALISWASFHLIKDETTNTAKNTEGGQTFRLPTKAILPLGIIAFCGMTGEGSMADWSAIYMHKTVGMNEAFSALAFGSFAASMTVGRIFGDYFTRELGKRKLLIYSSLLSFSGLALAILMPSAYIVLFGFFCVGLGLANVVPIVYSTAGNTEGVTPSVGIAMSTTIGYTGFFIGPPVIGYLSDLFSLKIGFVFTLILFVIMFFLVLKKRF
jgi:MFS family permease